MVGPHTNRRRFLAAIGTAVLGGCSATSRNPQSNEDWPTFHYSSANTGDNPGGTPPTGSNRQWEIDLGEVPYTSPVVADGTVFVGTKDGLLGLDETNGSVRWRELASGEPVPAATPTVVGDTIYVTADARYRPDGDEFASIYAFDTKTGDERWRVDVDDSAVYAPKVADGSVYVRSERAFLSLDSESGREQWRLTDLRPFEAEGYDTTADIAPAILEGTVFVPGPDRVTAVDGSDGTELWHTPVRKLRSGPAVTGKTLYATGVKSGVRAVDVTDGTERWTWSDGGCWTTPAVTGETVFATGYDLVALDPSDGTEKWTRELNGDVFSSPAVAGNTVVACSNGSTVAIDSTPGFLSEFLGNERWARFDLGSWYSPAVANGRVYVAGEDGTLTSLGES